MTSTQLDDAAAVAAGLVYTDDGQPGYRRRRCGKGFTYIDQDGSTLRDDDVVDRLRRLAVPPAWTEVWLCRDPRGHIQAVGRDAKGRKQYRYHPDWQQARNAAKFESLVDFGHSLVALRERVEADMRRRDLCSERVVATTVWLLDRTLIRIGNHEYSGDSYGLTTLLDEHVDVASDTLHFRFTGKSGKVHDVKLSDRRVARIVARCQELPGQQLLQYLDGDEVRRVGSRDVNDYIREVTRTDFTAKTFRTWGGSTSTLRALKAFGPAASVEEASAQVRAAITATAEQLRNTVAVCRSSYVHPAVVDAHVDGSLHVGRPRSRRGKHVLDGAELDLLALLDARL